MIQKWRSILTNWINCYFKESSKKDLTVNLETLLEIISHLRENLNSSLSNSSLLDTHTVQEFIAEKYPDFKFENGSVEPDSADDVYLAASLLLFFVCLNSKNVDLKNAMCSKLSPSDQETILKFSKHLMECPKITNTDVQTAISEACGQDMTTPEPNSMQVMVAETPPAIRSFHSEVRRLQAALDAERFDRTYLQEELTRTNLKVEKLLKDKEQYKLQIVDLKSQISQYCGQDRESGGDDAAANSSNKLVKQLEQMEQQLLSTQEQLEDVQYERETYKTKLAQLKAEHDHLLALSQQESARATSLAEELDTERRHTQSLRELVAELRQHNHLNRMDSSLLECDDPDTSIQSLQHNSSCCSEVCANVIEVQLGEERAKIVALKQQMQLLQEQLAEVIRNAEEETQSFKRIISEKENNIMDLKHRVNEEIEEKNTLKAIFNDDVAKLNNELNELEQRLKGSQENSRNIIDNKMQEIQNLQEEKLSLLQSLSDETTKLENIIKDLQYEIDAERSSKIRLREDYDNHIMKLNEKVLNRNNELVELQNKIVEKGEEIEDLQLKLRREKELREKLSNKHNNDIMQLNAVREKLEQDLQQKSEEARNLHDHLQQHVAVIEQINKENNHLQMTVTQLQEDCQILIDTKDKLQVEVKNRDVKAEQIYKETENLRNLLCEEKQKLQNNLEETNAAVNLLEGQLQNEMHLKVELKNELHKSQEENTRKEEEIQRIFSEYSHLKSDFKNLKEKTSEIDSALCNGLQNISEFIKQEALCMEELKEIFAQNFDDMSTLRKFECIDQLVAVLSTELVARKNTLNKLHNEHETMKGIVNQKELEVVELKKEIQNVQQEVEDKKVDFAKQMEAHKLSLESKNRDIHTMQQENQSLHNELNDVKIQLDTKVHSLKEKLIDNEHVTDKLKKSYDCQIDNLNMMVNKLTNYLKDKTGEIDALRKEKERLQQIVNENAKVIKSFEEEVKSLTHNQEKLISDFESERLVLKNMVTVTESVMEDQQVSLKKVIAEHSKVIETLTEENRLLQTLLDGEKKNHVTQISDKEFAIETAVKELNDLRQEMVDLENNSSSELQRLANEIVKLKNDLLIKEKEIEKLTEENKELNNLLAQYKNDLETLQKDSNEYKIQKDAIEAELTQELEKLKQELSHKFEHNKLLEDTIETALKELNDVKGEKVDLQNNTLSQMKCLADQVAGLKHDLQSKVLVIEKITHENEEFAGLLVQYKNDITVLQDTNNEYKIQKDSMEAELTHKFESLLKELDNRNKQNGTLETSLQEKIKYCNEAQATIKALNDQIIDLEKRKDHLEFIKIEYETKLQEMNLKLQANTQIESELVQLMCDHQHVLGTLEDKKSEIINLESLLMYEKEQHKLLQEDHNKEIQELTNRCSVMQECQSKTEQELQNKQKEIDMLKSEIDKKEEKFDMIKSEIEKKEKEIDMLKSDLKQLTEISEKNSRDRDELMARLRQEKDARITELSHELIEEREKCLKETEMKTAAVLEMRQKLEDVMKSDSDCTKLLRKENEVLKKTIAVRESCIKSLEQDIKSLRHDQEKLVNDFESERLELINTITNIESEKKREKDELEKDLSDHVKTIEILKGENISLQKIFDTEKENFETHIKDRESAIESALKQLNELEQTKVEIENKMTSQIQCLTNDVSQLKEDLQRKVDEVEVMTNKVKDLNNNVKKYKNEIAVLEEKNKENKIQKDANEIELTYELEELKRELNNKSKENSELDNLLQEKIQICNETQATIKALNDQITDLEKEKNDYATKLKELEMKMTVNSQMENDLRQLKCDHKELLEVLESKKSEIIKLESLLMYEKQQNQLMQDDNNNEKLNLSNKCSILQEYQIKAEQELESRQKEIDTLKSELKQLSESSEKSLRDRDELMSRMRQEKDALINKLSKELIEEREKCLKETELKAAAVYELRQKLDDVMRSETDSIKLLRKENEVLKKTLALKESFAVASYEKSSPKNATQDVDVRDPHPQVDNTPTDHTHSSLESYKTITDLEKILQDRNRTITSLQSDITYLKSLLAESEINLLDVTKDLEISKENCQQLSGQLKKIVYQKNEEIADLKKQVTKMSVNENRASQIIKVSAKYQAIILKRIAEIKSNTVLKELTNFGNSANCDNELRRSLNAGAVTMEDLENFLDTTDRHLKRCSEKQLALQKERDRLSEVNKINESEIIHMRKFLTELSVTIKTFNSVKELYTQKLSRIVSLQRTVKREILSVDGKITDAAMCKLQREYARVMQDLTECAMNLQRWVERCLCRAISAEKIKQAFSLDDRQSLAPTTFQNEGLEVQLEELENYFCKLLEEVARAQKGEGAKDPQAVTVLEVRAEYEDKLNRMKAKMKELYQEQIGIFKEKQREEIKTLEQELQKARDKLEESSRAYEEHIRTLTTELWNVGEKFLMKKDEAEWLRRKQRSGSLMSLQHVHSSGLVPPQEEPSRPSDTHSLRSLPVTANNDNNNGKKNEGRGLHMSDEEGEVFDNRCLRELATTPARVSGPRASRDPNRLSELQWRNSLCPPHLKSSYPAETQFVQTLHEEDIKCVGGAREMSLGGRTQRKEVGITAYKKPGPPTPSKQAGRLSATDSELRESLRVEMEPNASRKTSTPSRIRALFRSNKGDNVEGTPRSRRLSNIFRKK